MTFKHLEKLKLIQDVLDDAGCDFNDSVYFDWNVCMNPIKLRQAQISVKELITELESSEEYKGFLRHKNLMREFYDFVNRGSIIFDNNANNSFIPGFGVNWGFQSLTSEILLCYHKIS